MAHFALVKDGIVQVIYGVVNKVITDTQGVEQEAMGQEFLGGLYGENPEHFIQCSYNGSFRGVYPGPGFTYDPVADVFVAPEPAELPEEPIAEVPDVTV
jgi:hypothetical protein